MIITKGKKKNVAKLAGDLSAVFNEFNDISAQIKNDFDVDLLGEIKESFSEHSNLNNSETYVLNVRHMISRLESLQSQTFISTSSYIHILWKATRFTMEIKDFLLITEDMKPTFDFDGTKRELAEAIESFIQKVYNFDFNKNTITASGEEFIEAYRKKVLVTFHAHAGLLARSTSRHDSHYKEILDMYRNIQILDTPNSDIFDHHSGESPQNFLDGKVNPSNVRANFEYFLEYFKVKELFGDQNNPEEVLGEYNLKNMTELSTIIFNKWKATNPTGYGVANHEYIPPVSKNFFVLNSFNGDGTENLTLKIAEQKFFESLTGVFESFGSWADLWYYGKFWNAKNIMDVCEDHLVSIIDKEPTRQMQYDNFTKFYTVIYDRKLY